METQGAQGSPCPASPSPVPWRPWRPWTVTTAGSQVNQSEPGANPQILEWKGAFGFQHPVRLYLPISKREEYLRSSGEKVLASFPVQATIHFYDDDTDSETESEFELDPEPDSDPNPDEEEQEGGETQPPASQCQEQKAVGTVTQVDTEELDC